MEVLQSIVLSRTACNFFFSLPDLSIYFSPYIFCLLLGLIFIVFLNRGAAFSGGSVLLYGPPGTGKTTLGRACAKATGATLIELRATDVVHGTGETIHKIEVLNQSHHF